MTQISVKLPGDLIASVDAAAYQLRRTRGNYGDRVHLTRIIPLLLYFIQPNSQPEGRQRGQTH